MNLDNDPTCSGVTVEEVGTLVISGGVNGGGSPSEGFVPKRLVIYGPFMASLSDEGRTLMLAEFRNTRSSAVNDGWTLKSKR